MASNSRFDTYRQLKPRNASQLPVAVSKSVKAQLQSLSSLNTPETGPLSTSEETIEAVLKSFDLDSRYGPCAGMTRLERWERAEQLRLEPPQQVKRFVEAKGRGSSRDQCIWSGRL